jgi:Zn finger protein HypA/HybF involved in hydrogenase expression
MKKNWCYKNTHVPPCALISLAFAQYHFSTPEIRLLMRHVLAYALSGRTIKRLAKSAGRRLKRGRPLTTPRVHKSDVNNLIEATCNGVGAFSGNTLQLFHHIQVQFDLTPRQYLLWVAKFVRRGKCMMRKCLLCDRFFPSVDSGERHCPNCRSKRRSLVINDAGFAGEHFG